MSSVSSQRTILMIDDSPEDYEVTKRSFLKAGLANPIHWYTTGDEALEYLLGQKDNGSEPSPSLPSIILLDLNLPGIDGRDVLKTIKSHDQLKLIPVIILTTSSDERDIMACYRDGANSYIVKPVNLDGFFQAMKRLRDYWFDVVLFPNLNG